MGSCLGKQKEVERKSKSQPELAYSRQDGLHQQQVHRPPASISNGQNRRRVAKTAAANNSQTRRDQKPQQVAAKRSHGQAANNRSAKPIYSYTIQQLKGLSPRSISTHQPTNEDELRDLCRRSKRLRSTASEIAGSEVWQFTMLDERYYSAVEKNYLKPQVDVTNLANFSSNKYFTALLDLLKLEEAYRAVEVHKYDLFRKNLQIKSKDGQSIEEVNFTLNSPLESQQTILISPDDQVLLQRTQQRNLQLSSCGIKTVDSANSVVSLNLNKWKTFYRGMPTRNECPKTCTVSYWKDILAGSYDISFVLSNKTLELCKEAINLCKLDNPSTFALNFAAECDGASLIECSTYSDNQLAYVDGRIALDKQQLEVVKAVLNGFHRPLPYILTGPPGTGKTLTIIKAAYSVLQFQPESRILICCSDPSNICNVFAGHNSERLVIVPYIPALLKLYTEQKTQFDYVFVDNANLLNIAETFIFISLLRRTPKASLILAGDPNQIRPNNVRSKAARELGLGKSLLECLLKMPVYKLNNLDGQYSSNCMTKLMVSYRCDEEILAPSNKLFYNNKLEFKPKALSQEMNLIEHLNLASSKALRYVCSESATKWTNVEEAEVCVDIIQKLLSLSNLRLDEIGVITPFRQQTELICKKINALRLLQVPAISQDVDLLYKHQRLGTIDLVSGLEKEVVLISTVRSSKAKCEQEQEKGKDEEESSFLNDARQFNFAVSRAKQLVIVVGDRRYLDKIKFWKEFMKDARSLRLPNPQIRNKPVNR